VTQTVAITGASAGIGRAVARLFAERGARVGLIARGQAGLEGAARDVERAGGVALAVPADVADFAQVEAAAKQIEETLGPIDVWVNVAFASVFAPFAQITPEEFRRVTDVTYLGFVHGTMAALARMRPRDHGVIVQVGSALGSRSIPLEPVDRPSGDDHGAHGEFDGKAHSRSAQLALSHHPVAVTAAAGAATAAVGVALASRVRRR
jgi:NAD(P)-dependent dehydrogenase (short-subunit alcohol dehydrogenase family)